MSHYTTIPQYSHTLGATIPSYAPAQPMGEVSLPVMSSTTAALWGLASAVSSAACAYHGYKRNDSVGWAIGWALLGGMFPIITPAIAAAQGFGEKAKG